MNRYEEQEPGLSPKYRVIIGCGLIVVIGIAVWFGQKALNQSSRSHQDQKMIMVDLPPPPSTPLPSQPAPPPTESAPKFVTQDTVDPMETKSDTAPDQPPANDASVMGTSIQGAGGADGFGLRGNNNVGRGPGTITSAHKHSQWGWYANQVQRSISQALQSNNSTRTADFRVDARIWSDRTGRITRARLAGSTGNEAVDKVLTNLLVGLILQEAPPDGMPMPIVLRLTARHSNLASAR